MENDLERMVYEQTIRGLDRQAVVLAELRARASILLSAAGIIAALLGADALKGQAPRWAAVPAIVVMAVGLALSAQAFPREVVRQYGEARTKNYWTIQMLTKVLNTGAVLIVAQIVAWTVLLLVYPPRTP